jgi:4-hydroxyphenylpyruvate dioxygenase
MTIGITGIESFEFVVANLERSRRFYVDRMDFRETARSSRDRSQETGEESSVFSAAKIQVLVTTPLNQRSRAAKYLQWHPDGVPQISFRVKNLEQAWKFLEGNGATFVSDPIEHQGGGGSWRAFSITTALGDVLFQFVERQNYPGFAPGFETLAPPDEGNRYSFMAVDHITVNLLTLRPWFTWCRDTLGWEQFWEIQFHTEDVRKGAGGSGLKSVVMRDPDSNVKIAANEPLRPYFGHSQIAKFVDDHKGPGVQHIAFITPAIIPAVAGLKEHGIQFITTPASYYGALPERFKKVGLSMSTIKQPMEDLQRLGIQVDGANERYMLQIFLQEGGLLYDDPRAGPFFYEIIQRAGDPGFGYGNFRALFEAIERDQASRLNRFHGGT